MNIWRLLVLTVQLYIKLPVIGSFLRRQAAEALAQDGSARAVKALSQALVRSNDTQVKNIASNALHQIQEQECINSVCGVWAVTRRRDSTLTNLLTKKGWVASAPTKVKVLSALKVGQLDLIQKGDRETVEHLLQVVKDADLEIANRAIQCAGSLTHPDAIDYLCERWFLTRDCFLEQAVVQGGYVARKPIQVRVFSALKAGKHEAISHDGEDIVAPLLQAYKDKDTNIGAKANELMAELKNPLAINTVCKEWASTRDMQLAQALQRGCYIATSPIELHVLTALKVGQQQVVANSGVEIVKPLIGAFNDPDPEIVNCATQCASSLTNPDAIDELCKQWYETHASQLEQIVVRAGYVARKPVQVRVASALKTDKCQVSTIDGKTGQPQAITEGGAEVVVPLLEACESSDSTIAVRAQFAIRQLKNPDAQEVLCKLVIEEDHELARKVAVACQYAPRDPSQRALFFCLTELWNKYKSLDFDYTILQKVYEHSNEWVRQRIAQNIRQSGCAELLQVIVGGQQKQRLGAMNDAEWELLVSLLCGEKKWAEIWHFAQAAPPVWSVKLLQQLNAVKWVPNDPTEQMGFNELTCLAQYGQVHCLTTLSGHTDLVSCLAIDSNGQMLATGSQDKTVRLWTFPGSTLLQTLKGHTNWVVCLAISSNSKLLATGGKDRKVLLRALPDGKLLKTLVGHQDWVISLAISPDSKLLVSASDDKTVRLWSLPKGKLLKVITAHSSFVRCLAISPDGALLATGSEDKTVKLWSLPDGELLKTLTGHNGMVRCMAISYNGRLLVTGGYDSTVQLWSLPSGDVWKTLRGHTGKVMCLAIAPNGLWLATGSMDKTVRLWSLIDGSLLKTLKGHGNVVRGLAISPDGKYLVTGSGDQTVRLWVGKWLEQEYLPCGNLEDVAFVQAALQDKTMTNDERGWLEFSKALLRWRKRFDVELDEATEQTDFNEFDIEIEG